MSARGCASISTCGEPENEKHLPFIAPEREILTGFEAGRIREARRGRGLNNLALPKPTKMKNGQSRDGLIVARLQNLPATVFASFEVNMVRAPQFARITILNIGIRPGAIMGAPHTALGWCDFPLWNGHFRYSCIGGGIPATYADSRPTPPNLSGG